MSEENLVPMPKPTKKVKVKAVKRIKEESVKDREKCTGCKHKEVNVVKLPCFICSPDGEKDERDKMEKEKNYRALTTKDTIRATDLIINSRGTPKKVDFDEATVWMVGKKYSEEYRVTLREIVDFKDK